MVVEVDVCTRARRCGDRTTYADLTRRAVARSDKVSRAFHHDKNSGCLSPPLKSALHSPERPFAPVQSYGVSSGRTVLLISMFDCSTLNPGQLSGQSLTTRPTPCRERREIHDRRTFVGGRPLRTYPRRLPSSITVLFAPGLRSVASSGTCGTNVLSRAVGRSLRSISAAQTASAYTQHASGGVSRAAGDT